MLLRWPGVIKPGTIVNAIFSQEDWLPTLLAAAGDPNIVEELKNGYDANGKTWKVHADGYNFLPFFKGEVTKGPREEIYYLRQMRGYRACGETRRPIADGKRHRIPVCGTAAQP
jgi:arylsulfatase A-like enzyme